MNAHAIIQPQVDPTLFKLATGYEHMEMYFDLYGETHPEFGVDVQDVTLHGDKRSLIVLFTSTHIETMCNWCEREAEKAAKETRRDRAIEIAGALMLA